MPEGEFLGLPETLGFDWHDVQKSRYQMEVQVTGHWRPTCNKDLHLQVRHLLKTDAGS